MKIKIHGGRGSHPTSASPARIEEIMHRVWEFAKKKRLTTWKQIKEALTYEPRSMYQIYGGHTTCVEFMSPKAPMPIFFDAGTGLTAAGVDPDSALNHPDFKTGKGCLAFFMSHTHWDHVMGLPTIEQLFRVGNEFHFYGVHKKMSERIAAIFDEDHFPVPYRVVEKNFKFHQIELHSVIKFGELSISHYPQTHPGGSFAYRIEDGKKVFVFATDTELKNINPPHMTPGKNIYSDADLMILDAHYSPEDIVTHEGFGHSQIYTAVDFAVRERCKKLLLFHQSPFYEDEMIDQQLSRAREYLYEKYGEDCGTEISMTVEGLEVEV